MRNLLLLMKKNAGKMLINKYVIRKVLFIFSKAICVLFWPEAFLHCEKRQGSEAIVQKIKQCETKTIERSEHTESKKKKIQYKTTAPGVQKLHYMMFQGQEMALTFVML